MCFVIFDKLPPTFCFDSRRSSLQPKVISEIQHLVTKLESENEDMIVAVNAIYAIA